MNKILKLLGSWASNLSQLANVLLYQGTVMFYCVEKKIDNHNSVILRTQQVLQIPITNTILETMTLNTAQMTTLNYSMD